MDIDQAQFNFSPTLGLAVAVMVGLLVFAVALDLTWPQFQRVLRRPKAPLIGLVAQYLILPSVAFAVGRLAVETPSIALGLLLVTCCPAGALSNYLTGVVRFYGMSIVLEFNKPMKLAVAFGARSLSAWRQKACLHCRAPRG